MNAWSQEQANKYLKKIMDAFNEIAKAPAIAFAVAVKLLIANWLAIVWWAKMTTNECLSC